MSTTALQKRKVLFWILISRASSLIDAASITGSTIILSGCQSGSSDICGAYQYNAELSKPDTLSCLGEPNTFPGAPVYKHSTLNYYASTYVDYVTKNIYAVLSTQPCVERFSAFSRMWSQFPVSTNFYEASIPRAQPFINAVNGQQSQALVWTQSSNPPPSPPPPRPPPPSPPPPSPPPSPPSPPVVIKWYENVTLMTAFGVFGLLVIVWLGGTLFHVLYYAVFFHKAVENAASGSRKFKI